MTTCPARAGRWCSGALGTMTKHAGRALSSNRTSATTLTALSLLCGVAMALPQSATAQVAGGSEVGAGAPVIFNGGDTRQPDVPQCIHRASDLRGTSSMDDDRLVAWVTVHQPAIAIIKVGGSASGTATGTFAITLMSNGIPIARSHESRGNDFLYAHSDASLNLVPGRQYKITAKSTVNNKKLDLVNLYVGVGRTCP
jgi:hypothetical protein